MSDKNLKLNYKRNYLLLMILHQVIHLQLIKENIHILAKGVSKLDPLTAKYMIYYFTSSSSIPISPFVAYFFKTGKGLKIFFSIISIIKSKCGTTKLATKLGSFNKSNNSYR